MTRCAFRQLRRGAMNDAPMNLWLRIFLPFASGYVLSYFLRNVNAVIASDLGRELGISPSEADHDAVRLSPAPRWRDE